MVARLVLVLSLFAAATACSDDEQAVRPRGARGEFVPTAAQAPESARAASAAVAGSPGASDPGPFARTAPPDGEGRAGHSGAVPSAAPSTEAPAAERPERDLPAELRAGLGDPVACFTPPEGLPERIHVTITAMVSLSGRVTRAEVAGAGLPEAVLDCLRRRALAAQLRFPVEGAPRAVHTELEAVFRPAAEQPAAAP